MARETEAKAIAGRDLTLMIAVGEVLAGKYRVEAILGKGGMGLVAVAAHLELDERVAIKVLLPQLMSDPQFVARFLREGRNAVRIRSEHVARILDVGRLPGGEPFIVMEYLEGSDLARLLKLTRTLQVHDAIEIMMQTCEAVAAAHSLGIVHRDLKPANLFITERIDGTRCVKVLDFGISKTMEGFADGAGAMEAALTTTQGILGSPYYMSPEQMLTPRDVDGRSDIWALGVILYRMLCGRLPFHADNPLELAAKIASTAPQPFVHASTYAPPGLEAVVMRCLQRDRERRHQTVADFATALADVEPTLKPLAERIARISARKTGGATPQPRSARGDGGADSSGEHQETGIASVRTVGTPGFGSPSATPAHDHALSVGTTSLASQASSASGPAAPISQPRRATRRSLALLLVAASVVAIAVLVAFASFRAREKTGTRAGARARDRSTGAPTAEIPAAPSGSNLPPSTSTSATQEAPPKAVSDSAADKPAIKLTPPAPLVLAPPPSSKPSVSKPPPPKASASSSAGWGDRW